MAGYSPSVRLFEAAACATTVVSDNWPGLPAFFTPGTEVLLPGGCDDVLRYLSGYDQRELWRIGRAARERVLAGHTSEIRACEFEAAVNLAVAKRKETIVLAAEQ